MISIDLETSCQGKAEFRFYRKGFKIDSIAATWREGDELKSWYSDQPKSIDAFVRRLAETQKPLCVHNLGFELGVFRALYPDLAFNWQADTMRLAQLLDNGGDWREYIFKSVDDLINEALDKVEERDETTPKKGGPKKTGLSLEAVAYRFLPEQYHNHKAEAYTWLEKNAGVKSNHGSHLHLLPPDVLKRYNVADTEITLLLYETLTEQLKLANFDWQQDWQLYTTRCRLMQGAYIRGLKIDRESLREEIYKVDGQIKAVMDEFFEKTREARADWATRFPGKRKSKPTQPGDFNVGSNQQLKRLFVDVLGIVGGRTTKTGQAKVDSKSMSKEEAARVYPSFQSKHLHLWGPLGEILLKRRKLLLVLQQMLGVYMGSEEDGRLHAEIKTSGTATNRVAGSSGGFV